MPISDRVTTFALASFLNSAIAASSETAAGKNLSSDSEIVMEFGTTFEINSFATKNAQDSPNRFGTAFGGWIPRRSDYCGLGAFALSPLR